MAECAEIEELGPVLGTIQDSMECLRRACPTYQFEMLGLNPEDLPYLAEEATLVDQIGFPVALLPSIEPGMIGVRASDILTGRVVDWIRPAVLPFRETGQVTLRTET